MTKAINTTAPSKPVTAPAKTQQGATGKEGKRKDHEYQETPGELGDQQGLAAEPNRNGPCADTDTGERRQENEEQPFGVAPTSSDDPGQGQNKLHQTEPGEGPD